MSFALLWSIMSVVTTVEAASLTNATINGRDGAISLGAIGAEMREERWASQLYLGHPTGNHRALLASHRAGTDDALAAFGEQAATLTESGDEETRHSARQFFDGLANLEDMRREVDEGTTNRADALAGYTALLSSMHDVFDAINRGLADHGSLAQGMLTVELLRAWDQYSQADALLTGALAAREMTYEEAAHFVYLTAAYRNRFREARDNMSPATLERYETMVAGDAWADVERMSRSIVTREPTTPPEEPRAEPTQAVSALPVDLDEWRTSNTDLNAELHELVVTQATTTIESAWTAALRLIVINVGGSLLALLTGVLAILTVSRSARQLTQRLQQLRTETLDTAKTRLPDIVARAQRGERVNLNREMPTLDYGADEIGAVADAFNTAQRTAVAAAVKQAEISEGANRVFLSIAYRNQTLVQRQLSVLDEVERTEEDSWTLRKLFQLDHLATRGRRYADNLLILSGARSARRWQHPMPLVDVLRAAISEIEDYERVQLRYAPKMLIRGVAVADVVHLVAELVENATQFSPADSTVDVNSGGVAGRLTIEVEDRGLGMSESDYAAANETLAHAPEFDVMALSEEPRLGLFVVARLAARHGIRVRLCASPYGGTRAVALLPSHLLEPTEDSREERTDPHIRVGGPLSSHYASSPLQTEGTGGE